MDYREIVASINHEDMIDLLCQKLADLREERINLNIEISNLKKELAEWQKKYNTIDEWDTDSLMDIKHTIDFTGIELDRKERRLDKVEFMYLSLYFLGGIDVK